MLQISMCALISSEAASDVGGNLNGKDIEECRTCPCLSSLSSFQGTSRFLGINASPYSEAQNVKRVGLDLALFKAFPFGFQLLTSLPVDVE